jgi:hypothetical protein
VDKLWIECELFWHLSCFATRARKLNVATYQQVIHRLSTGSPEGAEQARRRPVDVRDRGAGHGEARGQLHIRVGASGQCRRRGDSPKVRGTGAGQRPYTYGQSRRQWAYGQSHTRVEHGQLHIRVGHAASGRARIALLLGRSFGVFFGL